MVRLPLRHAPSPRGVSEVSSHSPLRFSAPNRLPAADATDCLRTEVHLVVTAPPKRERTIWAFIWQFLGHYSRLDHLLTWGDHLARRPSSSHGPRPPHSPHRALSIEVRPVSFKKKLPVHPAAPIFSSCSVHLTKVIFTSILATRGLQDRRTTFYSPRHSTI